MTIQGNQVLVLQVLRQFLLALHLTNRLIKRRKLILKKKLDKKAKEKRDKQPASEQYVKYKAKELQKKLGKDARRNAHDQKEKGEPDRNKNQINEDYHY